MDHEAAKLLNHMTSAFYRTHAASFSATRQAPWQGWRELAGLLHARWDAEAAGGDAPTAPPAAATTAAAARPLHVLDLACGNLRFERFLTGEFPARKLAFHTVDNCDELALGAGLPGAGLPGANPSAATVPTGVHQAPTWDHQPLDVIACLLGNTGPALAAPPCDLAVSFGFLHHMPDSAARIRALELLVAHVRPGGLACVSLWRFADDPRAREKAERTTHQALEELGPSSTALLAQALESGDYLLGWQGQPDVHRYCHSFSDEDVAMLVEAAQPRASLIADFRADGGSGRSNQYLIFQAG